MTDKVTLGSFSSFTNDTTAINLINNNNSLITTSINNTLSRDGTSPNQMQSSLDMNSNQIINLPPPSTINSPARLVDVVNPVAVPNSILSGNNIYTGNNTFNNAITVPNNSIPNAELAQSPAHTYKGNNTGSTANVSDVTISQLVADINSVTNFVPNKNVYVSTVGNDSNDGLTWATAKLTLQAAQNTANPNGTVYVGAGTFTLTSTLNIQPGVRMTGNPGTIITQGTAANLNPLIDFSTNSANGASIDHCTIDGNRGNNTDDLGGGGLIHLIRVGTANDVLLEYNTIKNASGTGVAVFTGLRPIIRFNKLTNGYGPLVFIVTGVAGTSTHAQVVDNSFLFPIGQRAIYISESDFDIVARNDINASQAVGSAGGGGTLRVSSSGTTINWVSGPQFGGVSPGQYLVTSPGGVETESIIDFVNSATQLTVHVAPPALTNALAAIGAGDLINPNNSQFMKISDNTLFGGAINGIDPFNGQKPNGESMTNTDIVGNTILYPGQFGIRVASVAGTSTVQDINIIGNRILNPANGGAAGGPTLYGMQVTGPSIVGVLIDGNSVIDNQALTANWLFTGGSGTLVFVGNNFQRGAANPGVAGAITLVTLSAGWGTTASVSNIVSYGNAFSFTITASGTGQTNQPTVTVSTTATKPIQGTSAGNPIMSAKWASGSAGAVAQLLFGESATTPSAVTFTYLGTPVAASVHNILCV